MSDDLRTRIWRLMEAHGVGWLDNGTDDARCYCGYAPRLGESWHLHAADAVIRELNLDISHTYKTSQGREVCIEGFWTEEATDGTA